MIANLVGLLVLAGALMACLGSFGLLRMRTFYERVHPPTMGTTLGAAFVLAGSIVHFSALGSRPVIQEVLIALMMVVTTPVTYMILVRAALRRERPDAGD